MNYTEPTRDNAVAYFRKLRPEDKPLWGNLSAIGMVEHITDSLDLAQGNIPNIQLNIPEDKTDKAIGFLLSDHPFPKNFKAPYGDPDGETRNTTLEEAIKEFEEKWMKFEAYYTENPEATHTHPSFGNLNKELWLRVHSKHLTHHFQQFGLIPS